MRAKYNPSVNILRDEHAELEYIPTANAKRVATDIVSGFTNGIRSFNIIGSYGTGKSSFLWALAQTVKGPKSYFELPGFNTAKCRVIPFVGEYMSLKDFLAQKLCESRSAATTEDIFAEIYHRYHQLGTADGILVLLIDEFGKFLEYAAKNHPESELYFLQSLAEFINNPKYNILLLTTLHQNFDAYSFSLSNAQRLEWSKVKGRFHEITFNEPVEQLLQLAGEKLSQHAEFKPEKKAVRKTLELFESAKAFQIGSKAISQVGLQLYPLDLFSASVVALAMQRYGQNERSLFSFLESTDYTSIRGYDTRSNPFFNLSNLFDYLIFNYYAYLGSKYNPDNSAWASIKHTIERVENGFEGNVARDCLRIVKSIGLLNIFASKGARLDDNFWVSYASICLGIEDATESLKKLYDRRIIIYRKFEHRIILSESTDVDIQTELLLAGDQIGEIQDLVGKLNKYFKFSPLFAKFHYYHTGTPRIFEFILSRQPEVDVQPTTDTDGFINLIFNETIPESTVAKIAAENSHKAIAYGYFKNTQVLKDLVWEIEKTKRTKENIAKDDRIAQRELNNIQQHQEALLNHYLFQCLYDPQNQVSWYFQGRRYNIHNSRQFNIWLSGICDTVYSKTPVFKNELVNRSKLSSQIQTAKRAYFKQLVQFWGEPDLGFSDNRFPPERTIYLTLLKENGIVSGKIVDSSSLNRNIKPLWDFCEDFIEDSKQHKRPVSELVEGMLMPPFKLKQGLIDFWLPTFIFLKRDEIALFSNGVYLPVINEEVLELLAKKPKDFQVKKFDVDGIRLDFFNRYRDFLNLSNKDSITNQSFIETIRPFLSFYRQLPEYSKTTNRLRKESLAIRNAIAKATEPEKTFFEDFPAALGVTMQELKSSPESMSAYIRNLQGAIHEVRSCYDELLNRFEHFITAEILYESLPFEAYKSKLQNRYEHAKQHLLLPHHKTVLMRVSSALEDRKAWLNSLAQAVVGRTLENLRDEDEPALYEKLKNLLLELDALTELSRTADEDSDEAVMLEIASFESVQKRMVRFPKKKKNELKKIEETIKALLGKDKTLNIAALTNVLKELIKKT